MACVVCGGGRMKGNKSESSIRKLLQSSRSEMLIVLTRMMAVGMVRNRQIWDIFLK